MFETYRMLGEQHEAELVRRAETNATEAPRERKNMSRTRTAGLAAALTMIAACLFATGVWAGSERNAAADGGASEQRTSFWSFDSRTGYPTGPTGQPDFWNYDPTTGKKISNYSPGVRPDDLAALWSVAG